MASYHLTLLFTTLASTFLLVSSINNATIQPPSQFKVGNSFGWQPPPSDNTDFYIQWAEKYTFQVSDTLGQFFTLQYTICTSMLFCYTIIIICNYCFFLLVQFLCTRMTRLWVWTDGIFSIVMQVIQSHSLTMGITLSLWTSLVSSIS